MLRRCCHLRACDGCTSAQSPNAPYFGVWKLNPLKSDTGATQFTITESGGEFMNTDDNSKKSYKFRMDGKEYPDSDGATVATNAEGPTHLAGDLQD